jgi:hypothetical protein
MPTLRFEVTNSAAYPVAVNNATEGTGAAITVCELGGDPYVAFVAQTGYADEVVYLSLALDHEQKRDITPAGRDVIIGMGYHQPSARIWCGNFVPQTTEVFAFDPLTGLETASMDWSAAGLPVNVQGFGVSNNFFVRANGATLEIFTMNGIKLGERDYPGRFIQGVSASPSSWTFVDRTAGEIVVIGPFGNVIATAPTPGNPAGAAAIAYDMITDHSHMPQVIPPNGIPGPVGSPTHPDTPWNPAPWLFKHRLYYVDAEDQMIHAGYLTEQ